MVNPRAKGFNPIPAVGVNKYHEDSDVDSSTEAQHHTLGKGAMQAAPGNHDHDDDYMSKSGDFSDVEVGTYNYSTTGRCRMSRSGDIVELWVEVGTPVATDANILLVGIPAAHRPFMNYNRYINGVDAGSGGVVPCYLEPQGVRTVFNRTAGQTFYATWTYKAVPL